VRPPRAFRVLSFTTNLVGPRLREGKPRPSGGRREEATKCYNLSGGREDRVFPSAGKSFLARHGSIAPRGLPNLPRGPISAGDFSLSIAPPFLDPGPTSSARGRPRFRIESAEASRSPTWVVRVKRFPSSPPRVSCRDPPGDAFVGLVSGAKGTADQNVLTGGGDVSRGATSRGTAGGWRIRKFGPSSGPSPFGGPHRARGSGENPRFGPGGYPPGLMLFFFLPCVLPTIQEWFYRGEGKQPSNSFPLAEPPVPSGDPRADDHQFERPHVNYVRARRIRGRCTEVHLTRGLAIIDEPDESDSRKPPVVPRGRRKEAWGRVGTGKASSRSGGDCGHALRFRFFLGAAPRFGSAGFAKRPAEPRFRRRFRRESANTLGKTGCKPPVVWPSR